MTETEMVRAAMQAFKRIRYCKAVKIVGGEAQESGIADVLICYRGRFIAIEFKMPSLKHKLTALQCLFLDKVEDAGGYSAVCTSVDEAIDIIKGSRGKHSDWRNAAPEKAFEKGNRLFPTLPPTY